MMATKVKRMIMTDSQQYDKKGGNDDNDNGGEISDVVIMTM